MHIRQVHYMKMFIQIQPRKIKPFGIQIKSHLENSKINSDEIPKNPPRLNSKLTINVRIR